MATDPDPPRRRRAVTQHAEPVQAQPTAAPAKTVKIRRNPPKSAGKARPAAPALRQVLASRPRKPQGKTGAGHGQHPDSPLNQQQLDFVAYYLADPARNGTRAALEAGYSTRGAARAASRLLSYPPVQAEITRRLAPAMAELEITAADVIREFGRLGMSNVLDYGRIEGGEFVIDLSATTRAQAAAIQEVKTTRRSRTVGDVEITELTTGLKLASKREALSELARYFGLFRDDAGAAAVTVNFIVAGHPKAGTLTLTLEDESNG